MDNDDLDLIAGFAQMLNSETQQQNARIQNPNEGELIPPIKIGDIAPNAQPPVNPVSENGEVRPLPVENVLNDKGQLVDSEGVIDIPPELLANVGVRPQAENVGVRPQTPIQQPQPAVAPQNRVDDIGVNEVFHPDMQSVILRMLTTMVKNQEKIIKILVENEKVSAKQKVTPRKPRGNDDKK